MAAKTTRLALLTTIGMLLLSCSQAPAPPGLDAALPDAGAACTLDADCDDGAFCTGDERCAGGRCVPGASPCAAGACDEAARRCTTACTTDADGDGARAASCGGSDCDDGDPTRYPGALETCDAEDRDEDCDPSTFGFRDTDRDGWPDARCCNGTGDDRRCGSDCDDTAPSAHPSEAETCDGLDNDCDAMLDEGVTRTFHVDADGDGHADPLGATTDACFPPTGYAEIADDCDDAAAAAHPGGVETCEGPGDEDCDGTANPPALCSCTPPASRACARPGVCAAGTEICLGGMWGACSIAGSAEACDGEDDDCDGEIDEGLRVRCFADDDADTYPEPGAELVLSCPDEARVFVGRCPRAFTNREPLGAAALDCDDADAATFPGAVETCDGRDQNCDGMIDDALRVDCWRDADRDGFAASGAAVMRVCPDAAGECPASSTRRDPITAVDCDDGSAARSPAVAETCNGIDDDCDTIVDDGVRLACYADADGDGFAPAGAAAMLVCADAGGGCPPGRTTRAPGAGATDCDDASVLRSPASIEVCNAVDDDCDGAVDDGLPTSPRYLDADGDGYGTTMVVACGSLPGYASAGGDCRDDLPSVSPGQVGFRTTPACPVGATSCTAGDGRLGCRPTAGGTCDPAAGHWDHDCSGTVERSLTHSAACAFAPGGSSCLSPCVADPPGYLFDTAGSADCGRVVPLAYCSCSGIFGCQTLANTRDPGSALGCR